HGRITKDEVLEMMIDHIGDGLREANHKLDKAKGAHARFNYIKKIYTVELHRAHQALSDDEQVKFHKAHAMRAYILYLVDTSIFMDKSVTYTDVIYLQYFLDFE
ncbi:hypothetical protein KIW84_040606, partial [Lathyrus oleraceus]